jgi:adenosylcobyric acid synthase
VRIGVVRLPRISNYSDFDALEQEPGVELRYLGEPEEVDGLDLLVLPGTKSTLPDLQWLREKGFFRAIHDFHAAGGRVAGICGGFQMLGRTISDPDGVESGIAEAEGLGLLDVTTELKPVKQTHQVEAVPLPGAGALGLTGGERVGGYEIHMGETLCGALCRPLLRLTLRSGRQVDLEEGAVSSDGRVFGTYLHGIFDDADLRRPLMELLASRRGLSLPAGNACAPTADEELDRLADHLEAHLDIPFILGLLGPEGGGAR